MNIAIIAGHLGQDPELKYTKNESAVLRLRVATNDRIKRNGEWTDETTWHTVLMFGRRAEALNKHLHKGARVAARGRIQHRTYETRDGSKRTSHEILADDVDLFGGSGKQEGSRRESSAPQSDDPVEDDLF